MCIGQAAIGHSHLECAGAFVGGGNCTIAGCREPTNLPRRLLWRTCLRGANVYWLIRDSWLLCSRLLLRHSNRLTSAGRFFAWQFRCVPRAQRTPPLEVWREKRLPPRFAGQASGEVFGLFAPKVEPNLCLRKPVCKVLESRKILHLKISDHTRNSESYERKINKHLSYPSPVSDDDAVRETR